MWNKKPESEKKHKCACCGYYTVYFTGDICPVCFWEEDIVKDLEEPSCANHGLTLSQARENYKALGACEKEMLPYVRKPKPEELSWLDN